jgi:tryptophan halogenase
MRKNPQISNEPRVVKFRTGRYAKMWVGNVVGIGNASGFVEPLEATALTTIITQARGIASTLFDSDGAPTPSIIALYNRFVGDTWDEIRDFIALHYRFNTRLETPFWQACRADTDLGEAVGLVEFFEENGPQRPAPEFDAAS